LRKHFKIAYNPYFLLPFAIWVIVGGLLLRSYDKRALFEYVNSHHTPAADTLMYYITMMGQAEVIVPVLLLLILVPALRNVWYVATALTSNIIPLVLQQGVKSYYDLPRPLNYFNNAAWIHINPEWPVLMARSFPSGHSEGAFSFFCFLAMILTPKYRAWGALFFVLALSVCYSRLYLAAHFFADVYVGSIIGVVITMFVFVVMNICRELVLNRKKS